MILVTSSNWINCPFSRPSKVRMSFCQILAVLVLQMLLHIQNLSNCCKTSVWPVNFTKKNPRICYLTCLSLTNYLISKLRLPLQESFLPLCTSLISENWDNQAFLAIQILKNQPSKYVSNYPKELNYLSVQLSGY